MWFSKKVKELWPDNTPSTIREAEERAVTNEQKAFVRLALSVANKVYNDILGVKK